MNSRRITGQTGMDYQTTNTQAYFIIQVKSILTHHSSHGHNFSSLWQIELKLYTYLDESYRYHYNIIVSQIIALIYCTSCKILQFSTPYFFMRHPVHHQYSSILKKSCRILNLMKSLHEQSKNVGYAFYITRKVLSFVLENSWSD